MNAALDLGAFACRSLRGRGPALAIRRSRSLAVLVADGPQPRAWLRKMGLPFVPADGFLAVPGEPAEQLAAVFPVATLDLLPGGQVPDDDAVIRQLLALLIEALLPAATEEGDICCFTQPALRQVDGTCDAQLSRRMEFVARLVRLRGYQPRALNPAAALILAEMESEQFTGLGVCLGASGCDLALAHRGNLLEALRVPRGGRWIDDELARALGRQSIDWFGQRVPDLEGARRRKESLAACGPTGAVERLAEGTRQKLLTDVVGGLQRLLAAHRGVVRSLWPLTVILGGGTANLPGTEELLWELLQRRLPAEAIGAIRRSTASDTAVARGCLIHATLESLAQPDRRAAA